MLTKTLIILTALFFCVDVHGQTSPGSGSERLKTIEGLNPAQQKAVDNYIRENERLTGELKVTADRNRIAVRSSRALQLLFPKYRFVAVTWWYEAAPDALNKYSIPGPLAYTIVLDENGKNCMQPRTGNLEEYGDFLHAQKIKVADEASAALATTAFTDIYGIGMGSKNLRARRVRVVPGYEEFPFRAISSYEEIREASHYHISTDSQGIVMKGALVRDVLERRSIKQ